MQNRNKNGRERKERGPVSVCCGQERLVANQREKLTDATSHSILALRAPWTVWKGKMIGYWKRNSPGQWVPNMLLEISEEITPERMKGWSQSKKQYPAVDVTGDRSKVPCCKEQYCIGIWNVRSHELRQIGSGQTRDGKSEHRHSRNQQTKMDWNGWI